MFHNTRVAFLVGVVHNFLQTGTLPDDYLLGVVQGGRPVRIPDPNPPPLQTPPKVFFYPMCLYSKYSEFCGEFKNV